MTIVKEMIEALEKLDSSLPIIMPKDSEGNGYHAACLPSVAHCMDLDQSWMEDVLFEGDFEDEYEDLKVNCVVL